MSGLSTEITAARSNGLPVDAAGDELSPVGSAQRLPYVRPTIEQLGSVARVALFSGGATLV